MLSNQKLNLNTIKVNKILGQTILINKDIP